jgi:type IV secretory pathway VirB10-like protein
MTRAPFRPLREEGALSDPDLRQSAALLELVGPGSRSEIRKRRVWHALSTGAASRLGVRLRTLHFAFAALLVAAASSATVGGYYAVQRAPEAAPAPAVTPAAPVRAKSPPPRAARPAPAPIEVEPERAPVAAPPQAVARNKPEAAPAARAQSEAEAQLLVEAMRARREGDSKRVSELVDQYRAKHPQGTLQEEALILSVESAAARRAPNTAALAREYLTRFPNGRFTAQARRALAIEAR